MKHMLLSALVASTFVASSVYAQATSTETAAATAPTTQANSANPASSAVTPQVKKVKKSKKATATSAKASTTTVPAVVIEKPAATAPVVAAPAPAAATSTTAAPEAAAPTKKWGGLVNVYSNVYSLETQDVQTLTTFGTSYKLTNKIKVSAKQTFETLTVGHALRTSGVDEDTKKLNQTKRDKIESDNFRAAYSDLSVSTSFSGILGSNDLPFSVNYKHMNGNAVYVVDGGYKSAFGFVETNFSIPYTLTPKLDLSVDTQWRHVASRSGSSSNTNRLLAIPTLVYTINDVFAVYQSAGVIYSFDKNERMRNVAQRMFLATGVSLSPVKGLSIDMNINQDKAYYLSKVRSEKITDFSIYKSNTAKADDGSDATFDSVGYEATVTYSF